MDWNAVVLRHSRGAPLFSIGVSDHENAALRADLRGKVQELGIAGLKEGKEARKRFVLYASRFLAKNATRLEWGPVLVDLGVAEPERGRYVDLYDAVIEALDDFGRKLIVLNGERRFLATLLREGGLPTFIGDIASLIVDRVTEIGWSALQDESARTWVVGRVQQGSTGSARGLLDAAEGRLALTDFLQDAARARAALVDAGTDLSSLTSPEAVRAALEADGIPLPSVDNDQLLLAVLGSFTKDEVAKPAIATPLRLVASSSSGRVQLKLRIELDTLHLHALLPSGLSHATLTAESCDPPRRMLERRQASFVDSSTEKRVIELFRSGRKGDIAVDVRFCGGGGLQQVLPVGILEWPSSDALWFDADGELVVESRDELQAGEAFLIVIWDDQELRGEGAVVVSELIPPVGARRAYRVEPGGEGTLVIHRGCNLVRIAASKHRLEVVTLNPPPRDTFCRHGFVRSLPDVKVADGTPVDLYVRNERSRERKLVRRGLRGRISLRAERELRNAVGTVQVRLVAGDGRAWAASWRVLPRDFDVSSKDGRVVVRSTGIAMVHAIPGQVETVGNTITVTAPPDVDLVELFVTLHSGECLKIPVRVFRAAVRLWLDASCEKQLPLDGTTQLSERQVYAGACLEFSSGPGATLTVSKRMGDTVLSMTQPSVRPVRLPLHELAAFLQRANESPMTFIAAETVPNAEEHPFGVHVPRLTRPTARLNDTGTLELGFALDDMDLPAKPALALIPIRPSTATRALVRCDFVKLGEGKYMARLDPRHAPTLQGRYIAFLVDESVEPERPMSAPRAISVPLSLQELPCPVDLLGLDRALWLRDSEAAAEAINAMVGRPEMDAFLDAFVAVVRERRPYGLGHFDLFNVVAHRCPWVLIAALAHVPDEERDTWAAVWPQQIRDFTWLRLRESDAPRLRAAIPARSTVDRMALILCARNAHPMPRAIEYLLRDVLFPGDSLLPLRAARLAETNEEAAKRDKTWRPYQLPRTASGRRWLVGAELDGELLAVLEDFLDGQLLRGARTLAIRGLFRTRQIHQHCAQLDPPRSRVAEDVLANLRQDWVGVEPSQCMVHIESLDREIAIAAMLLNEYQKELRQLNAGVFTHILSLQSCSAELLDFWLIAVSVLTRVEP